MIAIHISENKNIDEPTAYNHIGLSFLYICNNFFYKEYINYRRCIIYERMVYLTNEKLREENMCRERIIFYTQNITRV